MAGSDGGSCLYSLLGVERTASKAEIRKAYHRLALLSHPDKHPDDPTAASRFQSLQRIKECLLDDERRAVYDETGLVGDESETAERFAGKSFDELRRYFRELNPAVTTDAIDEYEAKYRGSDEEVADLVAFYTRYDGCMQNATECVLFAEESDLHRFKLILDAQIAAGKLVITSEYAKFNPPPGPSTAEVVRRAKAKVKAGGRKGGGAKSGGGSSSGAAGEGDEASLFAMIRGRQASRAEAHDAMVDALAAKYAPKAGPSVGGKAARRGVQKSSKSKAAKGK